MINQTENEKNDEIYKTISKKIKYKLQDLEDDSERIVARKKQRDLDEINTLGINEHFN
jgi:hypothetical protein